MRTLVDPRRREFEAALYFTVNDEEHGTLLFFGEEPELHHPAVYYVELRHRDGERTLDRVWIVVSARKAPEGFGKWETDFADDTNCPASCPSGRWEGEPGLLGKLYIATGLPFERAEGDREAREPPFFRFPSQAELGHARRICPRGTVTTPPEDVWARELIDSFGPGPEMGAVPPALQVLQLLVQTVLVERQLGFRAARPRESRRGRPGGLARSWSRAESRRRPCRDHGMDVLVDEGERADGRPARGTVQSSTRQLGQVSPKKPPGVLA